MSFASSEDKTWGNDLTLAVWTWVRHKKEPSDNEWWMLDNKTSDQERTISWLVRCRSPSFSGLWLTWFVDYLSPSPVNIMPSSLSLIILPHLWMWAFALADPPIWNAFPFPWWSQFYLPFKIWLKFLGLLKVFSDFSSPYKSTLLGILHRLELSHDYLDRG